MCRESSGGCAREYVGDCFTGAKACGTQGGDDGPLWDWEGGSLLLAGVLRQSSGFGIVGGLGLGIFFLGGAQVRYLFAVLRLLVLLVFFRAAAAGKRTPPTEKQRQFKRLACLEAQGGQQGKEQQPAQRACVRKRTQPLRGSACICLWFALLRGAGAGCRRRCWSVD